MAGSILAIPAIGLTAIYAVLRFANFALASHATIGAFAGFIANTAWGLPVVPSLCCAFLAAGVVGVLSDELVLKPFRAAGFITTAIGSDRADHRAGERGALRVRQRAARRTICRSGATGGWAASGSGRSRSRTSRLPPSSMAAVFAFLAFTRTGKAMRAVADNPMLADIKGIDADRVGAAGQSSWAWGWPGSAAC